MQNNLRVALAQVNFTVGDLSANARKIEEALEKAKGLGADIITFPELSVCGYPPEDLLLKKHFIDDNITIIKKLSKKISGIVAVVGFVDRDKKGNLYNAAAVISDKKIKGIYHKQDLPNYGVFDEKRYFTEGKTGSTSSIYELNGIIFSVNICEDIWRPGGISRMQAKEGAQIEFNISASPYYTGKLNKRKRVLVAQAKKSRAYICYTNLVGGQDELVFDGGSFIIDKQGREITRGRQFQQDLIVADIIFNKKKKTKIKGRAKPIKLKAAALKNKPSLPDRKIEKLNRLDEIYEALVLGTRDYIRKNNFSKVVIGLSGGVDSSLVAAIAVDAVGRDNVTGISMPSRYTSAQTKQDTKKFAGNLGIRLMRIPINSIFKSYLTELKGVFEGRGQDKTEENIQARIRGNILMALSNKFGWLVITTGNKSETSVGYCTLYGDMAGGFAMIKDVPKMLVYELARRINKKADKGVIPESIIKKAPSAELKRNQKDQDTLPRYELLDKILKAYIEEDKSYEQIVARKFKPAVVKKVIKMVDDNEYKRRQAPPGIRITPKAFGRDRRLPIVNKYREF